MMNEFDDCRAKRIENVMEMMDIWELISYQTRNCFWDLEVAGPSIWDDS
jgi:hypothetical protein